MKKWMLLLILLIGCSRPTVYDNYVNSLKEKTNYSSDLPFKIEFYIDNVNEERIIYQMIIDEVEYELKNVKVLVIHNAKTNDVFPSIGIVDEPITLNNENKGIILMGYINKIKDIEFKVLIQTDNEEFVYQYIY